MKFKLRATVCAALLMLGASVITASAAPANEREVRGVVERVFQQLKSGDYGSLYDALPANSQRRLTRERFTSMLQQTRDMYQLDRLEIGAVKVSGDIAVVDTVMYGRVHRPVQSEGKIVAQQYLVREDGRWRVATGDRATVRRFLASNPGFAKKFTLRDPRVYVKREGRWVDISSLAKAAAKRRAG